ncbi:actin, muscle [Plakobranchus ocellatus]|uniref:Actin, muscle n=1 Tax=Plakobranchus ocellatus TaxID=259542 RepID=A0AAV4AA51_9GAST|nr:actin, muscle [Plakobranchus ocellatus]
MAQAPAGQALQEMMPLCLFFPMSLAKGGMKLLKENYIGDEAQDKRELLTLRYPIEHGIIVKWEDMEKIWNHMFFSELKISPEQHPILISDPPFNPKGHKEKFVQVMFENYQVPAFFLAFEPMLCLLSTGRNQGTLLNIGEGYTSVASFWESHSPFHAVSRHDFGGKDLTLYLRQLLHQRGYSFTTTSELEIVREIKERFCCIPQSISIQNVGCSVPKGEKKFKLLDGTYISLGEELYTCPDTLFTPDGVFNSTGESLAEMVHKSITACDITCRRDMYCSVLLCGGSTLIPGFADRLRAELVEGRKGYDHAPSRVRVIDAPERKYHTWIGGSILASLSTFAHVWITREEYREYGPLILHRKST